jgi:hypothetical protein
MKMVGYILYGHKTYDYIQHEPHATGILDKIDEYRRTWLWYLQRQIVEVHTGGVFIAGSYIMT